MHVTGPHENVFVSPVERAPYKTRCDGVTPTYSVPELAIVVACQLCFGDHPTAPSSLLSPILLHNFELLEKLEFLSDSTLNINSVLTKAIHSLSEADDEPFMSNLNEAIDDESYVMRHKSFYIVEHMIRKMRKFRAKRSH